MAELWGQIAEDRDRVRHELNELQLAIFAGEDGHEVMGTPFQITVTWPEGPPPGFADADEFRQWARARLAKLREGERG